MSELGILEKVQDIGRDLESTGRKANTELGNFRLYGKSKHQQYYTPNELAKTVYEMLIPAIRKESKIEDLSVIDPTCGSGRLLHPWKKVKAQVLGIELDKEAALVAKRLIGKENVRVGNILDYSNHLRNFNIAVVNPPYGIYWDISDRNISFDSECYGSSVESQAATIEITTNALAYDGILACIIPTTTFTNAKDNKAKNHLYENYKVLLKATLANVFKEEYKIDVAIDLIVAIKNYGHGDKKPYEKIELDLLKDIHWKTTLINLMWKIIRQEEISIYPSRTAYVPFLDAIKPIPVNNCISITPKGLAGDISVISLLDFTNHVLKDYNPIQGIETGIIDAYMSKSTLIRRGVEAGKDILSYMGFEVSIAEKDLRKLGQLKEKYDFLSTPMYRPKSHQLLSYFYDREERAKDTVTDKEGKILFEKDKSYRFHPTWVRRKQVVNIATAYDERKKKDVTIKTEVDRGYLAIKIISEQGEKTFNEIEVEEIKLLTDAFLLPEIKDVSDKYPELVEANRKRIAKEMPFLFDYQMEDLARLALKPFGYIGYDMGGGKTLTAACWAKFRGYKQILVVCQSGLINNWLNELAKFGFKAERLSTHTSIDKLQQRKRNKKKPEERIFYITSYEFLSLDSGKKYDPWDCMEYDKDGNVRRSSPGNTSGKCPECHRQFSSVIKECPKCKARQEWTGVVCNKCGYAAYTYTNERKMYPAYKRFRKMFSAVIVDECQLAKSKNSLRGRAVRTLNPKGKLILTGTLMKGYVTDLYWSVGWLLGHGNPLFPYNYVGGSKLFLNEFGTFEYVTKQFEDTLSEGRAKLIPEVSNLNRFWRIIASFTIRRLKDEMIELPKKHKHILLLPMDQEHTDIYNEYQEWAKNRISKALQMASQNGQDVNMGIISSALWKLRFASTVPNASDYLCSGEGPARVVSNGSWNKVDRVVEIVREVRKRNEKVIIFSGLRPMVSAIAKSLKRYGIGFLPIVAANKTSQRFEMIERFSNDHSLTAIIAGLNVLNRGFTITAANNVIITDLQYSPESTLQAEDRAHRTGQQKEVSVYYLLSQSTIDEDMFELISQKQTAISNAIDGRVVYSDVAELLENMRGNIQLEVARRIVERETVKVEIVKEIPKEETITTDYEEPKNVFWDEVYEELLKKRMKRRRKNHISADQLVLFE